MNIVKSIDNIHKTQLDRLFMQRLKMDVPFYVRLTCFQKLARSAGPLFRVCSQICDHLSRERDSQIVEGHLTKSLRYQLEETLRECKLVGCRIAAE